MRVLVVGAGGAIGARLVPQLVARGHEVVATSRSEEKAGRLRALGAEPVVLDLLDRVAVLRGRRRRPAGRARPRGDGARRDGRHQALRPHLRGHEPPAHGGHGQPPRRGARRRGRARRRAELRRLALRPGRRARQDRGGSARPGAGAGDARDARRDPPPRGRRPRGGRDGAPLRRPLRLAGRRPARAGAEAAVPDRRRRRRRLVVRPPRRRGRGDRARASSGARRASSTSSTTSPRPSRSGCPRSRRRSARRRRDACRAGSRASRPGSPASR